MGCKSCRERKAKRKFTKCNFCGQLNIPLPLKPENVRGKRVMCTQCILKGVIKK